MDNNETEQIKNAPEKNNKKREHKKVNKRKLKYGSVAAAITVIFIAAVVLINVLASQMTTRFGLKVDVTDKQLFEISDETINYLKTLNDEVDISVMVAEEDLDNGGMYLKLVKEITQKYAVNSDKIKLNFYDPEKNPQIVNKYKDLYSDTIKAQDVVINCGQRIKVIPMTDLYEMSYDQSGQQKIKAITAEKVLTSAIMFVSNPNPPKVAILKVSSSDSVTASLSKLNTIYEANGYVVETVDPLSEDISEDYSMVILPAPHNDLTQTVIDKLDAYLYNNGDLGKNLFYMASFEQMETPNLDAFIEEWGIGVGPGFVKSTDSKKSVQVPIAGLGNYYSSALGQIQPLKDDQDKEIKLVNKTDVPLVVPFSRPLTTLFDSDGDRKTSVLVTVPDSSVVNEKNEVIDDQETTHNALIVGSKTAFKDSKSLSSNVIVCGTTYMFDYAITSVNEVNNQELLINISNNYSGKEEGITILSKSLELDSIKITDAQASVIRYMVIVIIPLLVVVIGCVVFIRRKNR